MEQMVELLTESIIIAGMKNWDEKNCEHCEQTVVLLLRTNRWLGACASLHRSDVTPKVPETARIKTKTMAVMPTMEMHFLSHHLLW